MNSPSVVSLHSRVGASSSGEHADGPLSLPSNATNRESSELIAQAAQVGPDLLLQPRRLLELAGELRRQPPHPLLERLAVVLSLGCAHEAAGRQHAAVRRDQFRGGALAEAGHVGVAGRARLAAPGVVRTGDARDVLVAQLLVRAVDERAHLAGVDEQRLAAAVAAGAAAPRPVALVARQEPQAHGDLRGVEELPGQGDHAVDEVCLHELLADLPFPALLRAHRAVGEHEAGHALRRQVVDHVLHPGEVGVAHRRRPVLPAHVVAQALAAPVAHVERRVAEDEVGLQVLVLIGVEGVGVVRPQVALEAADGEVHLGQAPGGGVALLPVDGDVAAAAAVLLHEALALHEHAARTAAGVVHAALERLEHLDQQLDHAARRVELAAALALGAGEAAEEVLVDAAQQVLAAALRVAHGDGADEVDELTELLLVDGGACVVFAQHALEAGVLALDRHHGVVDELADVGLLGARLEVRPARLARHPEDVVGEVLVAVFRVDAGLAGAAGREAPGGLLLGLREQGRVLLLEGVTDVLEKDEAERHVLVLGRVHVAAHLVGGGPELLLEAEGGAVGLLGLRTHYSPLPSPCTLSTYQFRTASSASKAAGSFIIARGKDTVLVRASSGILTRGMELTRSSNTPPKLGSDRGSFFRAIRKRNSIVPSDMSLTI